MWNVTWDPVHLCMTDSRPLDLCRHQSELALPQNLKAVTHVNHNHTHHPPHHLHTHTARPHCTSIAIIHQIYLHWSRAKIKTGPPPLPTHLTPSAAAKSNHSSILAVIDWLPIQLNLSQMEVGGGWRAALLKAIRHWHWQEGLGVGWGGWKRGDRREKSEMAGEEK